MSSTNPGPATTSTTNTMLATTPPNGVNNYTANTATSATTLAASSLVVGDLVVVNMTGTLGAGANLTTDTAANWIAAQGVPTGDYILRIINSSSGAFSWTVVAGTGVTLNGTATIAQNTWREFRVQLNQSAGTVTMQSIGTGTYS
jgi:hypothetical protein